MMSGPLVVLGASGLVGGVFTRLARARGHEVLGVARSVLGDATTALDVTDVASLDAYFTEHSPSAVVICSAYSHVDGCEADPTASEKQNIGSVRAVVQALRGARVPVVFYSTDQVFDGSRDAHVESDRPNPLNVYSRHKLAAEELLLARGDALIVRTAWVFGEEIRRKNFVYRVASAARTGEHLKLPRDQAGCPTASTWLTDSTLTLLEQGLRGVIHLTGDTAYTKAEWARTIASALTLPELALEEVDWTAAGQVAPRPARVVLASERHALRPSPVTDALAQLHI